MNPADPKHTPNPKPTDPKPTPGKFSNTAEGTAPDTVPLVPLFLRKDHDLVLPEKRLWSYWEGPMPPIIGLCFETIARHNPELRVVTPDSLIELGGEDVLKMVEGLPSPQRSDLIRLWLIREFGGVWVDSDTVSIAPLDFINIYQDYDLLGTYNPFLGRDMLSTPFGARKGSPIISEMFQRCKTLLSGMKNNHHVPYGMTSVGLLSEFFLRNENSPSVKRFEHWKFNRIPYTKARREFLARRSDGRNHEVCKAYNPLGQTYHLTNPITDALKSETRESILKGKRFVEWLIQKALEVRPGIMARAAEICKRVPVGRHMLGAEIGVLRGINSRQILQRRPRLSMICVDLWSVSPNVDRYNVSRDAIARKSPAEWKRIEAQARRNLEFAGERKAIVKRPSIDAARDIPPSSLDFVFIDAEHTYGAVQEDIQAWIPKVRKGGWIGGHDYMKKWPGVVQAVDEFFGTEIETGADGTWFHYV